MYVQFETNTRCNAKCAMCIHRERDVKRPTLSDIDLGEVLTKILPMASTICPFLYQEPCLEPRLPLILREIKVRKPSCKTVIYSNMAAMTQELAEAVLPSLDELYVSFSGPTKELYELYQTGLDYEKVQSNIYRFMALKAKMNVACRVQINYLASEELMGLWEAFREKWSKIVDNVAWVNYEDFNGRMTLRSKPIHGRTVKEDRTSVCARAMNSWTVLSTGEVVLCCLDYRAETVLGNVLTQSIEEIEENRKALKEGWVPDLCKKCMY